jgi:hypothetical protein
MGTWVLLRAAPVSTYRLIRLRRHSASASPFFRAFLLHRAPPAALIRPPPAISTLLLSSTNIVSSISMCTLLLSSYSLFYLRCSPPPLPRPALLDLFLPFLSRLFLLCASIAGSPRILHFGPTIDLGFWSLIALLFPARCWCGCTYTSGYGLVRHWPRSP